MEDDKLIPLSYISQYGYCKRRAGLLLLEQQWSDSADTAKGSTEHKNVHTAGISERNNIRTLTDLQVISHSMNLCGRCDAVEAVESDNGYLIPFLGQKRFALYPIEYKHGKLRAETEYELQLCAQAMCIEEMFDCRIDRGAIFYISSHRRKEIEITDKYRDSVRRTADALSEMLIQQTVPDAEPSLKCIRCSLKDICLPETPRSVSDYMKRLKHEIREVP